MVVVMHQQLTSLQNQNKTKWVARVLWFSGLTIESKIT
jgi:hypothetical protein